MDLFERMNRRFSRIWDAWDEEWEDMEKFMDESIETSKDGDKDTRNTFSRTFHQEVRNSPDKNYSISYHYETGMEEPKITVHGDPGKEVIDNFLENVKTTHKPFLNGKKMEQIGEGKREWKPREYTVKMPGIGQKDLKYKIKGNKITITGENKKHNYRESFWVPFETKDVELHADNGLIDVKIIPKS